MNTPYVAGFGKSLVLKDVPDFMQSMMIERPHIIKEENGDFVGDMSDFSQEECVRLLEKLRSLGLAFSYGRDWAPSEIFEYYREKGLLSGSYKRISWTGPNKCLIEDR